MTIHVRDSGGSSKIANAYFRDASGLHKCSAFRMRDASGLHDLLNTLSASGPAEVDGFGYSVKPIQVTTSVAAIAVKGGTAPFTYSWAVDTGWSATGPTASSTAFRSPTLASGATQSMTAVCTITDAEGNSVTVDVLAVCTNNA